MNSKILNRWSSWPGNIVTDRPDNLPNLPYKINCKYAKIRAYDMTQVKKKYTLSDRGIDNTADQCVKIKIKAFAMELKEPWEINYDDSYNIWLYQRNWSYSIINILKKCLIILKMMRKILHRWSPGIICEDEKTFNTMYNLHGFRYELSLTICVYPLRADTGLTDSLHDRWIFRGWLDQHRSSKRFPK